MDGYVNVLFAPKLYLLSVSKLCLIYGIDDLEGLF